MSTSRTIVIDRIRRWLEGEAFIDRLLGDVTEDRAFVMEMAYGIVRWKSRLEWLVDTCCPRRPAGLPLAALMTGLYQIFFMDSIQPHAAVNETVTSLRTLGGERATGLVNAVLRGCLRRREALIAQMEQLPLPIRLSHPAALIHRWRSQYGEAATLALCLWNNARPEVSIHPRPHLTTMEDYQQLLRDHGVSARPHPLRPGAFLVLPRGVAIPSLPGFAEGLFSVQDPATAGAVDLLDPQPGERILDACAAPGGKTALIADRIKGDIVAMEISDTRLRTLRENAQRLQLAVTILQGDILHPPEAVRAQPFDRILLDVPCTNTGVLQRRPDARWRFGEEPLAAMTRQQDAMLTAAAPWLKPGGVLLYSTCSLEPEENERLIERWTRNHGYVVEQTFRSLPPGSGGDGAFAARLRLA